MHQICQVAAVEAEFPPEDVGDELGAGLVVGVVEFRSGRVAVEVRGIRVGKEGALVVVKPPVHTIGGGVLEIDDRVQVTVESGLVE